MCCNKTKQFDEVVSDEDTSLVFPLSELQIADSSSDAESDAACPKCGLLFIQ